jgi:hypothetical protein
MHAHPDSSKSTFLFEAIGVGVEKMKSDEKFHTEGCSESEEHQRYPHQQLHLRQPSRTLDTIQRSAALDLLRRPGLRSETGGRYIRPERRF